MKKMILMMAAVLAFGAAAFANENMGDIAVDKAVKEHAIQVMQDAIARHQNMTKEEILADIGTQMQSKLALLKEHGYNIDGAAVLKQVSQLDKEGMLALETQQLQTMMTSSNVIFFLTRSDMTAMDQDRWCDVCVYGDAFLLPFAIVIDVAFLPFEIIGTAVSGF